MNYSVTSLLPLAALHCIPHIIIMLLFMVQHCLVHDSDWSEEVEQLCRRRMCLFNDVIISIVISYIDVCSA